MRLSDRLGALLGCALVVLALAGCSTTAVESAGSAATPTAVVSAGPASARPANPSPKRALWAVPSPACAGNTTRTKHIYVSIGEQHLWACAGKRLFLDRRVTTGASALTDVHDATPVGTWRVVGKTRNTVLSGADVNGSWNDHVRYWMPFAGGDGFHDAPWQTFPLGSPLYRTEGSHGCIHLALRDVAALYRWAPVGTLVTVRP